MLRLLLIPVGLLALLAGAIFWSGTATETPADLRWINAGDPKTLDPGQMSWGQDIRLANALWEGLYRFDSAEALPQPGVADHVDISPDSLTYTFHLRNNARWSNGEAVVAGDFVFAWKRVLDQAGDYTSLFFYIEGAQDYAAVLRGDSPQTADFSKVAITAVDERTLRVTLKHPVPFFLDLCAFPTFFPLHEKSIPPDLISRDPATGAINIGQGFPRPPLVSNGPFTLTDWRYKQRIRLTKNENYWDKEDVSINVMDVISADNGFAAFQMYETGAVDWIADVHPEVAAKLKTTGRDDFHITTGFGTYYYEFLCDDKLPDGRPNPFRDVRVRRAFAMAINKQTITDNIVITGELPTTNFIPRGVFKGYVSPPGIGINLAEARRLLAEAGYPNGKDFPRITLLYNTNAGHERVAEYIRRQWLDNLGVEVSLEGIELKIFGAMKRQGLFHVCRASWIGDYPDPSTFTDKYLSFSQNNDANWKNAEYDRLCELAAREADPKRRLELLSQAESIMLDQAAVVPIYSYVNRVLVRPYVKGMNPNPRNQQDFKRLRIERD